MTLDAITRQWIHSPADERAADRGCVFKPERAERVRHFFAKYLRHSKGAWAGQPFELLDWEWLSWIAPLYGWVRPDGTRRYRRASWWVAKKNGKSSCAAGLILYGLMGDNEPGAECYGAAADRNQASIIFTETKHMVQQSPAIAAKLRINDTLKRITYEAKRSFYQVLSKDAGRTGHGVNSSLSVIDELHVVNRELYDTLRYGGAARRQPLQVEISTAGNDKLSLGYERYQYAKSLLAGVIEDDETLPFIAEADGNDVWDEEEQWHRANPSLGVTISLDSFRADFKEASNSSPATQGNFRQLRLNIWQDATFAWIPLDEWDACRADITEEQAAGSDCYGAFDLASKLDLTAWAKVFRVGDEFWLFFRFWAPEDADSTRQRANRAQLKPWIASGHIKATPGNVTDYDAVEQDILADVERLAIKEAAFDPWNAAQVATHLMAQGLQVYEFPQTMRNYNEPMKEFEKLVKSRKIKHDGNPVMRWMMGHLSARKDPSGNIRPDKEHSADHIDGPCAAIMALARAILQPAEATWFEPGMWSR